MGALADFAFDVGAAADLADFQSVVTAGVAGLVPCDLASYTEIDLKRRRAIVLLDRRIAGEDDVVISFARFADQHPLVTRTVGHAQTISDYLSFRRFSALELYSEVYRRLGARDQLAINLECTPGVAIGVALNRSRSSFDMRDRATLDQVRPLLVRGYRAALARERGRALLRRLERGDGRAAVAVLSTDGRLEYASDRARTLLRSYAGQVDLAELPPTVRGPRGVLEITVADGGDAAIYAARAPRAAQRLAADPPRAPAAGPGRGGRQQPGDRRRARHQRVHRSEPPPIGLPQARRKQPDGRCGCAELPVLDGDRVECRRASLRRVGSAGPRSDAAAVARGRARVAHRDRGGGRHPAPGHPRCAADRSGRRIRDGPRSPMPGRPQGGPPHRGQPRLRGRPGGGGGRSTRRGAGDPRRGGGGQRRDRAPRCRPAERRGRGRRARPHALQHGRPRRARPGHGPGRDRGAPRPRPARARARHRDAAAAPGRAPDRLGADPARHPVRADRRFGRRRPDRARRGRRGHRRLRPGGRERGRGQQGRHLRPGAGGARRGDPVRRRRTDLDDRLHARPPAPGSRSRSARPTKCGRRARRRRRHAATRPSTSPRPIWCRRS